MSGGKDSNFALYTAITEGHEVACIVVVHPLRSDSWMFHTINTSVALLQATAMGLGDRVIEARVSGVKEREVEELEGVIRRAYESIGFDALVVGALASAYQRRRVEGIASRIGVKVYAPYWGMDPERYMRLLVESGLEFVITRISTMGLNPRLLAKPITRGDVEELLLLARRYGFHPAFEGGEAETLVLDAPHYKSRVCIEGYTRRLGPHEYDLVVTRAWLGSKDSRCLHVERLALDEPFRVQPSPIS